MIRPDRQCGASGYRLDQPQLGASAPRLGPVAHTPAAPLSFAQQRLWLLDQLTPGAAIYNIPAPVRLAGSLHQAALAQSLDAIMRRHEVLRTTFTMLDGQPVQVIARAARLPLAVVDLRALPEAERDDHARRLAVVEAQRPFALATGPLLRTTLLLLDDREHVLLITMHQIISDGWSIDLFIRELAALYTGLVRGRPAALPHLPIQYADYAIWQHAWLQGSGVWGQGSGARSQESGVRSQESDVSASQIQNHGLSQGEGSKLKTQNSKLKTAPPSPIPHPPSPIQACLAYWRTQLADLVTLNLPTDRPRPTVQRYRGGTQSVALSAELSGRLKALSQRAEVTLFMTLLAAFQILLSRYSGQTDIVVGSPIAGRTQAAVEGLIGLFVNTLVLRADLAGNPAFPALLGRVREVCLGAYAHQDLPFELLLEELHPQRDLSRTPLFQVLFVLQSAPLPALELADLTLSPMDVASRTARFDLTMSLTEMEQGLLGVCEYSTDLFETSTIIRMLGHFQTLLEGIVAAPELQLADLPLLTDAERRQVLLDWNATQVAHSQDTCVHALFEAQVEQRPDALAVAFDGPGARDQGPGRQGDKEQGTSDPQSPIPARPLRYACPASPILSPQSSVLSPQSLTYRELNERANRLAHHLRAHGVGPEVRAGIYLERSPDLVIAMLGILKAGGAFVLLDPAAPPERLSFMLEDSQAAVLITTTDHRPTTNDQRPTTNDSLHPLTPSPPHPLTPSPCHLVTLSDSWPAIALYAADDPSGALDPASLAYVVYTSGSTGQPKGALLSHAGLVNLVHWHRHAFGVTARDRATQVAGPAFDATVWEVWPYLAAGASLHIPPDEARAEPARMRTWLLDHAITICFLPTPLAEQALLLAWPPTAALRTLLTGGDRLHHAPPAALPFALVNNYGPTESTVVTTSGQVHPTEQAAEAPAIGRPIANIQVYVLDPQLRPVPIGVPGELYIGGVGLARGYLGRPDLTAERFVPNPFAGGMVDKRSAGGGLGWGMGTGDTFDKETRRQGLPREGTRGDEETRRRGDDESTTQNSKLKTQNLRLYRTGDLVRYRPDGAIAFLGRMDEQVKLRGFRIELGEIAAVLGQHPAVQQAVVVVAAADVPGEQRLLAYLVMRTEGRGLSEADSSVLSPQSSVLRSFLKQRLPDYMIPAAFVVLDALPLTPNGKVDRRALPLPKDMPTDRDRPYVAPRTPIEAVLAGMWSDALQIAQVSIHDNFFDQGGHSLNATRIVSRIRQAFQIDLTVRHLFEAPTVASLADHMVATETQPGRTDKIARALQRLKQVSAEDRQKILQQRKGSERI